MSDQDYRLVAPMRNYVWYSRSPYARSLPSLPDDYPQLKVYYDRIISKNLTEIDDIIVEENSLLPALHGDFDAMVEFLSPLVNGKIIVSSMGAIATFTGWMVVAFDHVVDEDSWKEEEFTTLYITELPIEAKIAFSNQEASSQFILPMH